MPGLRPTRPTPLEPEDDSNSAIVNFNYMKIQSQSGHEFYAMTFQQIISLLDNISDYMGEGEESAMYHFDQIRRILGGYIQNDD